MNILTKDVLGAGVIESERVVLRVVRDENIGTYLLSAGTIQKDGDLAMDIRPLFWFPDDMLKAGDLIVVYTKAGKHKIKVNDDKSTSRFYYLGYDAPLWNATKRAVVFAKIESWDFFAVPSEDETTREP
jgi:hypothetical protein